MPIIQVTMLEGRSPDQKRDFMARLTSAAVEALGSDPQSVRIVLNEVSPDHFGVAGESMTERQARASQ